jgi:hypothetical protein
VLAAVAASPFEMVRSGEPVQHLELRRRQCQLAVLVLAVEGEQARPQRPEVGGGGRAPLDERARPTRQPDAPAEHDLARALREPLRDLRQLGLLEQPVGQGEHPFHVRLLGAGSDDLRPGLPAHQQIYRVGEDRLARPGLAGDRVEPLSEPQLGTLDQQQALDP